MRTACDDGVNNSVESSDFPFGGRHAEKFRVHASIIALVDSFGPVIYRVTTARFTSTGYTAARITYR